MRLIDADELNKELQQRVGSPTDEKLYEANLCIIDAPTIHAIPVEWLRGYTAVGVAPTGDRLTEGKERLIVHRILNEWQKEQEASE
jgi:hypothetical protein